MLLDLGKIPEALLPHLVGESDLLDLKKKLLSLIFKGVINPLLEYPNGQPKAGCLSTASLYFILCTELFRVGPDAALSLDLVDSVGSLVDGNQQQLLSLDS